jgi:hypothetical protein
VTHKRARQTQAGTEHSEGACSTRVREWLHCIASIRLSCPVLPPPPLLSSLPTWLPLLLLLLLLPAAPPAGNRTDACSRAVSPSQGHSHAGGEARRGGGQRQKAHATGGMHSSVACPPTAVDWNPRTVVRPRRWLPQWQVVPVTYAESADRQTDQGTGANGHRVSSNGATARQCELTALAPLGWWGAVLGRVESPNPSATTWGAASRARNGGGQTERDTELEWQTRDRGTNCGGKLSWQKDAVGFADC